jgi:hypothetical protein
MEYRRIRRLLSLGHPAQQPRDEVGQRKCLEMFVVHELEQVSHPGCQMSLRQSKDSVAFGISEALLL